MMMFCCNVFIGEWSKWQVLNYCDSAVSESTETLLVRTCYNKKEESLLCGGNNEKKTTQEK